MRKLKQICASLSLVVALSLTALAGDLHTGATQPPPPPPNDVNDATSVDPLAQLAFALLNGVLSIF